VTYRLLIAGALALASGAQAQEHPGHTERGESRSGNSYANPSAVIATELAFAQAAQDKGQWSAFAAYAAPDAVMFTPQMVYAQGWLKGRANPPIAVKWQVNEVWSSCDGSLMVSHGAWQHPNNGSGWFTTIWQRQKDGSYKWLLDHGGDLTAPLAAPEMISGRIADCPDRAARPTPMPSTSQGKSKGLPPLNPALHAGKSVDGSLTWQVTGTTNGAHSLVVHWKKDGHDQIALSDTVGDQ
jgi:ketosteroid isomerase-like protein